MVHRLTAQWSWGWYPHAPAWCWWHRMTVHEGYVTDPPAWDVWSLDCGPLCLRFRRKRVGG